MKELEEEASDPRPLLCVGLCLKNQNVMCRLVCFRPCFVLLSELVRTRGRGLGSKASFVCSFVLE